MRNRYTPGAGKYFTIGSVEFEYTMAISIRNEMLIVLSDSGSGSGVLYTYFYKGS